jgi:16S rRNA processing protein RimM
MTERVCVGAIVGAFGVKGEVRLKSFTADPAALATYAPLFTEDGKRSFAVTLTGTVPNGLSARLSGVRTRDEAEALRGTQLFADRAKLPALEDDEFYHADLIGLTACDAGGTVLGKVVSVMNHGAGDVIEVLGPGMKQSLVLPFTRAVVPTVDIPGGRLVVDLPEEI